MDRFCGEFGGTSPIPNCAFVHSLDKSLSSHSQDTIPKKKKPLHNNLAKEILHSQSRRRAATAAVARYPGVIDTGINGRRMSTKNSRRNYLRSSKFQFFGPSSSSSSPGHLKCPQSFIYFSAPKDAIPWADSIEPEVGSLVTHSGHGGECAL